MRCVGSKWRLCACLALAIGSTGAGAQGGYTAPEQNLGQAIESLAARAADVFTGQVIAIDRKGGTVEIAFAVEQTLQGQTGGRYTLREWAGLWPPGEFRYHVGERALVFMLPANTAGLSSPVDGSEGVLPLVATTAEGPALVDARRLDARLQRDVGQPLPLESNAAVALDDVVRTIQTAHMRDENGVPLHAGPPRRLPLRPGPAVPVTAPAAPVTAPRFIGHPRLPEVSLDPH